MDGTDETLKMDPRADMDELCRRALKRFFPGRNAGDVPPATKIARIYKELEVREDELAYLDKRAKQSEAERVKVAKELQEARSENRKMRETLEELETELDNRKRGNDLLRAKLEQVTLKAQRKAEQEANEYRITPPAGMKILTVYFSTIDEQEEEE